MSLKSHPSEKHKSVNLYEYKLFDKQTDGLAEVMDKMSTRCLGKQRQQNRPYIHRGRGHRNYLSYDRSYARGRGHSKRGPKIETEDDICRCRFLILFVLMYQMNFSITE